MKECFTQGSIIESIRSNKHQKFRCKGIVISARCDIANDKIKSFYCLTALTVKEWISDVLFFQFLEEKKKSVFERIKTYADLKDLDTTTLIGLGPDRALISMQSYAKAKEIKNINKIIEDWKSINDLYSQDISIENRLEFVKKQKDFKQKMTLLHNSAYPKYVFIPESAYSQTKSTLNGLVVDLQDLVQIDMCIKSGIINEQYDYMIFGEDRKEECAEINRTFFFECNDDFIIITGIIGSPWIEYIMQQFALSFIRIGVDNADPQSIQNFCDNII